jgi:phage FluMu protein Com
MDHLSIKDQLAVACFVKHGDMKCPRCNRGLLIWSQLRQPQAPTTEQGDK